MAATRMPIEVKHRSLGRVLGDHGRYPQNQVVQTADGNFENRDLIEKGLDARKPPQKYQHAQNDPRSPCLNNLARAVTVLAARAPISLVSFEPPNLFGMPHKKQHSHCRHRADRRNHVHQPRPMKIGHEKLRNCEEHSGNQHRRPNFNHPVEPGKGPQQPERHQHRKERKNPSRHAAQLQQVEARNRLKRNQRYWQSAKGRRPAAA